MLVIFLLLYCSNVYSTVIYSECKIISKDPDLKAECLYGSVWIKDEKVNSLELISFPKGVNENFSSAGVQKLIFYNKEYPSEKSQYDGFNSFDNPGEYEFLVNGKHLKIKVYTEFTHGINDSNALFFFIIPITVISLFILLIIFFFVKKQKNFNTR